LDNCLGRLRRTAGAGGTVLPPSARSRGMTTTSPEALRTVKDVRSAASRIPRTSAVSSPPPSAGRRQRSTTRFPMSAAAARGPSRYRTALPGCPRAPAAHHPDAEGYPPVPGRRCLRGAHRQSAPRPGAATLRLAPLRAVLRGQLGDAHAELSERLQPVRG